MIEFLIRAYLTAFACDRVVCDEAWFDKPADLGEARIQARQQQPGWYPALLQLIADAELAFIVDPIDGTENFTANPSLFGVMAAVRSAPRSISWLSTKMTERRSGPWADRKIDGRRG